MSCMRKNLLNMRGARLPEQKKKMEYIKKQGVCPFCSKYFKKYHDAPIIKENSSWFLTKNDYPYDGTKIHLLLIHKKHIETIQEISLKAREEMFSLASWTIKKFKISGGGLSMRFGDFKYNGATVAHLHSHIIMGSKEGKGKERLLVQLGFKTRK